jgi:hypothetical protein
MQVSDEGCTGNMREEPCRNMTSLYLPRKGELVRLVSFAAERRDYVNEGEPGAPGRIEYRLTSAPRFVNEGLRLFEQMSAKDEAGRELRTAELERVFTLRDVVLVPSEGSLWPRIFPRPTTDDENGGKLTQPAQGAQPAQPTKPASPKSPGAKPGGTAGNAPVPLKPKYGCCDEDFKISPPPKGTLCTACARPPQCAAARRYRSRL